MSENKEIGFWKLIQKHKIEIPIIQRDYAQGRDNSKTEKIRIKFLNDLILAIESAAIENKQSLELDFVYGSVDKDTLQPLDGQQRLTTLYLLHWYIALKTGRLNQTIETKNTLLKFTYETRISSREFCSSLVSNNENLGEGSSISKKIEDSNWFFLSWKKDPTIKAMLLMLDCIEKILKEKTENNLKDFWTTLTSENPPITFHFKELSEIGLTDDLYIKMNARGKALTEFENFKARFEKHIENNRWEAEITIPTGTFLHKIDTVWTDLFWKHRGEDNKIDNEFIKFITGCAINYYAQSLKIFESIEDQQRVKKELEEKSKGKSVTDEAIERQRIEQRLAHLFNNPKDINPTDFSTEKSFEYLIKCLDIYSNEKKYDELLPDNLKFWNFCKVQKVKINSNEEIDNNLFIEFIKEELTTYSQRVLFYAQTEYLLKAGVFNFELFSNWMRIARNIVQNSTIDTASTFISAISLINEISVGSSDVCNYLAISTIKSGHASKQVIQEKIKAKIILANPAYRQEIFITEDTNFCKGNIDFALYCIDYDSNNPTTFNVEKLKKIQEIIKLDLNIENNVTDDFKRAFLTIKNNDYYDVWPSWSHSFSCHKRWLLNKNIDLINFATSNDWKKEYLKDLLVQRMSKTFSKIADEFTVPSGMPKWKEKLIKGSAKLNGATFILFPDDNSYCKLAWQQRPSREDQVTKVTNK
jgi:hypothetical protein